MRHSQKYDLLNKQLVAEYNKTLIQEELIWYQKSRNNWLCYGDRNTKFFHASTIIRRHRNSIIKLKDNADNWVEEPDALQLLARHFYKTLFTDNDRDNFSYGWGNFPTLSRSQVNSLEALVLEDEVRQTVFSLGASKAPGPDGFHALFFQKFWEHVKLKVCDFVKKIFQGQLSCENIHQTFLCLIPKISTPEYMSQFRPIGLCNVIFKVITKVVVHRLKPLMPSLIKPNQSSFVPGRQISGNIIIAQELIHTMKNKKGRKGYMVIKLDLAKAYDRLRWGFIHDTLIDVGLPENLRTVIMDSITTVSMQVLWNGRPTESFKPTRGVRQGDPLSPYIFVLCLERFLQQISQLVKVRKWLPIFLGKGPPISHLCFADDILLICEASLNQAELVKDCLRNFCNASGQEVSASKTHVYFSKNVSDDTASSICNCLGYMKTNDLGRYLGMPILHGKISKGTYAAILEKIDERLSGWKVDRLSFAGRVTLAKSVLNAIPSYAMQTIKLPRSLCDAIDKKIQNFIWGTHGDIRKPHLANWNEVCKPKNQGGLGL